MNNMSQRDRDVRRATFQEAAAMCDWEQESSPSNHTGAARCAKAIRETIATEDKWFPPDRKEN